MTPMRKSHLIMKIMSMSIMDLPAPINISLWWNYGSLLSLFLMIQIISGLFLSMHYNPSTKYAFMSLIHIMNNVNWGWMLHSMHMNGASFFMLTMYIHMGRSIYYNSFYLMETWNIGVTIFIMTMATAFMGYVLPWGQMSYWGATVITNIFSAIPYLGTQLVEWLWGGFSINNATLNRFFAMHFMFPFIILFLMMLHFMFLHKSGSNNPLGINSNCDRIPFHIYFSTKDMMGFIMFLLLFMMMIMFYPNLLMDPENFYEANSMMTPNHIQPEWYFLWLYAVLRSIPNKLGGVMALLSAIIILYLPPMLLNKWKMSLNMFPINQSMFFMLFMSWLMLNWIGSCPVENPYIIMGQMFSTLYFSYFLLSPEMLMLWNKIITK